MALTVPAADTARDQTGNRIAVSSRHIAAAGLDDQAAHAARLQRGGQQFAKVTVVKRDVGATTSTSPAWHCSTATWIIQLSPGGTLTVTAVPEIWVPG